MRLTTKIVIGFSIFIFISSLVWIIVPSTLDELESKKLSISQENIISIEVKPYKTIIMENEPNIGEKYRVYPQGIISIKPINISEEENKLFVPEELALFTDFISSNDTLIIRLKTKDLYEKYVTRIRRNKNRFPTVGGFNLSVYTNAVDIKNSLSWIATDVRNIKTDKIKIDTSGKLSIDSCQANVIEPYMRNYFVNFQLSNSQAKELNIDLDWEVKNFIIRNCDIEVENLTGTNPRNVGIKRSDAKVVNWIPETKYAELNITLYSDTARIVFP